MEKTIKEEKKSNTPRRRGRLSRMLYGENIKDDRRTSQEEEAICDRHIDGA